MSLIAGSNHKSSKEKNKLVNFAPFPTSDLCTWASLLTLLFPKIFYYVRNLSDICLLGPEHVHEPRNLGGAPLSHRHATPIIPRSNKLSREKEFYCCEPLRFDESELIVRNIRQGKNGRKLRMVWANALHDFA
jgi:hypothetical protein